MDNRTRNRTYNFNPGPAALPLDVLEETQRELLDYEGRGMALMEMSHRSEPVETLMAETERLLLELMGIEDAGYRALFMGGGASAQFALVPLNFLTGREAPALCALTGSFADKAMSEAAFVGRVAVAASSRDRNWRYVPPLGPTQIPQHAAYLHITTNNTIEGTRWNAIPATGGVPLVADMTSDLLSRELDFRKFSLVYAGAQKNLGPAGVTVVVVRDDLLERASDRIPVILRYGTYAKERSLYNTPPVQAIYVMNRMLGWTKAQGGAREMERRNRAKAAMLYEAIDGSGGFYRGIVDEADRSQMNVTWRMPSEELERRFVAESKREGFEGLAGHRSVGGLRASIYNGVPEEACRTLVAFMAEFLRRNGYRRPGNPLTFRRVGRVGPSLRPSCLAISVLALWLPAFSF